MKVNLERISQKNIFSIKVLLLLLVSQFVLSTFVKAEGTVDFINYPGYRLMLFAERQQQTKVFAHTGEFINFGASHVGTTGGLIKVYRPDGTLHSTYDNTGASNGLAIINNNIEEQTGPTGGGSTMGNGYVPGIVEVLPGEEGSWSITFEYPSYTNAPFDNLLNADAWDRLDDQPTNQRVVLAWDITVSQNAAGNNGGNLLTGRVYTNEYQSIINFNGNLTSPTFYVLTPDGFQYQVDFEDVDPWGFPIFSNSWGLVDGNSKPTYSSWEDADITRSVDVDNWDPNLTYLYEPQAEDTDLIINNKVFFNLPDPNMPSESVTTDIYRNNTHTTWLFNSPAPGIIEVEDISLIGAQDESADPVYNAFDPISGAWFVFESSLAGTVRLDLDINENGSFNDVVDVTLFTRTNGGALDSIHWNGSDGLGNQITTPQDLAIPYTLSVFGGEIHVQMGDVENVLGGVSFSRINGINAPVDTFYFDHRNIGSIASGGATNSGPLATTTPFSYSENFGNRKTLDYWTYVSFAVDTSIFYIDVVEDLNDVAPDSDGDTVRDDVDIDDDNDGIPDKMEYCIGAAAFSCLPGGFDPSGDFDFDGVLNFQDANDLEYNNPCTDNDNDGRCDNIPAIFDWDGDGIPNHLDLDSDNDGVTDLVEANHNQPDLDNNGIIDGPSVIFKINGLYDPIATNPDDLDATINYTIADTDLDGLPDFLDLDSDNDGITDLAESGHNLLIDANNDGMGDGVFPLTVNTKGLLNEINPTLTGNGIPQPLNSDNDEVEDFRDRDSDNDGITDVLEGGNIDGDNDGIIGLGTPTINDFGVVISDGNGTLVPYATSNPTDTDGDGVADYQDLDSDNDGINDVVEGGNLDADNDGIVGTGVPAVNADGQTTINGLIASTSNPTDTDGDGVADYQDLDSDNDGINDVVEGGNLDADNDGIVGTGVPTVNADGQTMEGGVIVSTSNPTDTDGDGVADYQDLDSDNDGINDVVEGGNLDADNDGIVGTGVPTVNADGQTMEGGVIVSTSNPTDTDGDGVADYQDLDSDNDGINDVVEGGNLDADNDGIVGTGVPTVNADGQTMEGGVIVSTSNPTDTDSDGVEDYQDLDSDNDGINDVVEGGNLDADNDGIVGTGIPTINADGQTMEGGVIVSTSNPTDTDSDGVEDYQDLDSDNDGINDVVEGGNLDADNDGIVGTGVPTVNADGQTMEGGVIVSTSNPTDTDGDGVADYQDLDSDNDGINDVVEGGNLDADNDGIVGTGVPAVNADGQTTINGLIASTSNPTDTDSDGVADYQDLDSDNDGINDVVEGGNLDFDNDGIVGTGIPTINADGQTMEGGLVVSTSNPTDTDSDGVEDYQDLDSDNDGINDVVEGGNLDFDNDGIVGTGIPTINADGQTMEGGLVVSTSNPTDTDSDGVEDYQDLDSDNDGINDVVEGGNLDPDNNGMVGTGVPAVNADGQTTVNGVIASTSNPTDTDGDGVADSQDLDSDNDGINDVVEGGNLDPDNNGMVGTGIPTINADGQTMEGGLVVSTSNPTDTDSDGVEDYQDLDSDNDGINDVVEGGNLDPDNNGMVGTGIPTINADGQTMEGGLVVSTSNPTDTDSDGVEDYQDLDSDNDGINDVVEGGNLDPDDNGMVGTGVPAVNADGQTTVNGVIASTSNPTDTDGNGDPDYTDLDSDDDGLEDMGECSTGSPCFDFDNDGTPDFQDIDSDNDGVDDGYECPTGFPCPDTDNDGNTNQNDLDSDDDGIQDENECPNGYPCPDFDADGDEDYVDVDSDDDGLPDEEECPNGAPCPDFNGDGNTDQLDAGCTIAVDQALLVSNGAVCQGEDIVLSVENSNTYFTAYPESTIEFIWIDADGTSYNTSDNAELVVPTGNTSTTQVFTVRVNVDGCISNNSEPMSISVSSPPTATIMTAPTEICQGETIQLMAETVPNASYNWYVAGTTTSISTLQNPTFTNITGNTIYELVVQSADCPTQSSDQVVINVTPEPQIQLVASTLSFCSGEQVVLSANNNIAITGNLTYTWTAPDGETFTATVPASEDLDWDLGMASDISTGNYEIMVETQDGCMTNPQTVEVEVADELSTPTLELSSNVACEGDALIISIPNANYGNVTYEWMYQGNLIEPTTTPSYQLSAINESSIGDYTVNVISENCGTAQSAAVSLNVINTSDVPTIQNDTEFENICEGQDVKLTAGLYQEAFYRWYGPNGLLPDQDGSNVYTLFNVEESDEGLYRAEVELDFNISCPPLVSQNTLVEVSKQLEAAELIASQTAVCQGGSVTLTLNNNVDFNTLTGLTYSWHFINDNLGIDELLGNTADPIFLIENMSTGDMGTYYVLINFPDACVSAEYVSIHIDINSVPDQGAYAGADDAICGEEVYVLNAAPISVGTGQWTSLSGATIVNPTLESTLAVNLEEGDNVFVWSLSNGACENYHVDTVVISLNTPDEMADAGTDVTLDCDEQMFELNAVLPSAGAGQWTSLSNATIVNPNQANAMATGLQPGDNVFVWSLSLGSCSDYATDTILVSLNTPNEVANAGADVILDCNEEMFELNAVMPSAGVGQWTSLSNMNQIVNPNQANAMATGLQPGDNVFVWSLSLGACSNYATDTVTVSLNTPNEVANAGVDDMQCGSDIYQLNAMMPSIGTGQWTSPSGATITNPNQANTMVENLQEGENTFVWSLSNGSCMDYAQDMVVISFNSTTAIANAGTDQSICSSDSYQLNAMLPSAGTGQWTSPSGATVMNPTQPNTMVENLQEGDNTFVWSLSNGSCPDYTQDTVVISYNAVVDQATLLTDSEINLCLDGQGTIMLEAAMPTLATGTWTQTIGPSVATIMDTSAATTEVNTLEEGLYVFTWTLSQDDCVSFSDASVAINISETPAESAFVMDNFMVTCVQNEIMIEAVETQISEGQWIALSDGINILDDDNPLTTISGLSMGENQIVWTLSHENCANYSMDTLTIVVEQGVATSDDVYSIDFGQGLSNANVLSNDSYDATGTWSVRVENAPQNGTLNLNDAGDITYVPNSDFSGTDVFTYILCNENCGDCQEATVNIEVLPEINTDCFVPNIVTANNDGFNDALVIPCVLYHPNNHIMIFNRWGDKVYDAESYQNDWKGEFNNVMLPSGTYFYIFKKDKNEEDAMQGYITIYR